MIALLTGAWAFDSCPEPDRPTILELEAQCQDDILDMLVVVETEVSRVAVVEVEIRYGDEVLTEVVMLHLVDADLDSNPSTWMNSVEGLDCSEHWKLRAIAYDEDGQSDEEDLWLGFSGGLENGGWEAGMENWATAGNAYDLWEEELGISPEGDAMLAMGWAPNSGYVHGSAWQPLGDLAPGSYELRWSDAVATEHYDDDDCPQDTVPTFTARIVTHSGTTFDTDVARQDFAPIDFFCDAEWIDPSELGFVRRDWVQRTLSFTVESDTDLLYAWFGTSGGHHALNHWVYLDSASLSFEGVGSSAAVLPSEPTWLELEKDTDLDFWEIGETGFNAWYQERCVGCSERNGHYGSNNGFDGVFTYPDGSGLIVESKTTRTHCLEDEASALTYKNRARRKNVLVKCDNKPCTQDSSLWIRGTIRDLCAEGGDQQTLARDLEEAWDHGQLYFSWAVAGTDPVNGCESTNGHWADAWFLEPFPAPVKDDPAEELCP